MANINGSGFIREIRRSFGVWAARAFLGVLLVLGILWAVPWAYDQVGEITTRIQGIEEAATYAVNLLLAFVVVAAFVLASAGSVMLASIVVGRFTGFWRLREDVDLLKADVRLLKDDVREIKEHLWLERT